LTPNKGLKLYIPFTERIFTFKTTAFIALKSGGVSVDYYKLRNKSHFIFHQSNIC